MTYELYGVKVSCVGDISRDEAGVYVKEQLKLAPQKTLLSMELSAHGDEVTVTPHYDSVVRVRRITGYLSTLPRFNDAKKQEVADRKAHMS